MRNDIDEQKSIDLKLNFLHRNSEMIWLWCARDLRNRSLTLREHTNVYAICYAFHFECAFFLLLFVSFSFLFICLAIYLFGWSRIIIIMKKALLLIARYVYMCVMWIDSNELIKDQFPFMLVCGYCYSICARAYARTQENELRTKPMKNMIIAHKCKMIDAKVASHWNRSIGIKIARIYIYIYAYPMKIIIIEFKWECIKWACVCVKLNGRSTAYQ